MFSAREMPSPSSIFSAYASMAASVMLFRSMANDLIPHPVRSYLHNTFRYFIKTSSPVLTLVIEEFCGMSRNQVFEAAEVYLSSKASLQNRRLKISKTPKEKSLKIRLEKNEQMVDSYSGIELKWILTYAESGNNNNNQSDINSKGYFELSFNKKHRETIVNSYLPFVLEKAKSIKDEERMLKMHTLSYPGGKWDSINLEHPSTFETLAMEPDLKNAVMEDLNRFVRRKDFYKKVGRAWKRGYLLYGPPGTGKSSLVAAIANYLKFDIYDLQLENITRDSELRRLLLSTANRSILVIEDIDCSVDLPDHRHHVEGRKHAEPPHKLTLSGLLNFIDGLWSSCGDERIIIFTTNHKERLDPALLRPGRMDMHIHMSYCSYHGFKLLASNYLGTSSEQHPDLFTEIEGLIEDTNVTPAQVAEELMKSEEAKDALEDFVGLLKRKKMEGDVCENDETEKALIPEAKRARVNNGKQGKTKRKNSHGHNNRKYMSKTGFPGTDE
ncbi:hypothetical protein K1719_019329 [Acacia pycnantha]|nr:hypothetical protein K1719_019329 [Acacia pycnantha]